MKLVNRSIAFLLGITSQNSFTSDHSSASSVIIPPTISNSPAHAEFIASSNNIDASKMLNTNITSFGQWWVFNAISSKDPSYSIDAVFAASPFVDLYYGSTIPSEKILQVQVFVHTEEKSYTAISNFADFAELNAHGKGTSGVWKGTGCSFSVSEDLSTATVNFAHPFEITGSVVLKSVSFIFIQLFVK